MILVWLVALAACDSQDKTTFDEYLARAQKARDAGEIGTSVVALKSAVKKQPQNAKGRLLLAQAELDLGDGVSADIELRRAIELGTPRDSVILLVGETRLQLEQFEALLREIRVKEEAPAASRAAVLGLRGRAHVGLGQIALAEEAFNASLALDEKSVDALVGLARLHLARGDAAQGRNYLTRAEQVWPLHLGVLALQGDVAFAAGDHVAAVQSFNTVLGHRKDGLAALDARLGIARSQFASGRFEEAIVLLGQVLGVAAGDAATNYLRALAAYQLKDYETARLHAELALRATEGHRPSLFIAGAANYAQGRYEAALVHLNTYLAAVPDNSDARKLLAAAQMRLGRSDDAVGTLRPAADRPGFDDIELLAMIGTASAQAGDFRSASRYLGRAVAKNPENPSLRSRLGATAVALGNVSDGLRELEKAASLDPEGNADVALILAQLRIRAYEDAVAAAQRLQAKRPTDPNGYTLAATAELARGQTEAARTGFRKALQVRPGDRNALRNLAVIAAAEHDFDGARGYYREVLSRRPNDEEFLILLAGLESRAGRPRESRAILERAVALNPESVNARVALGHHYLLAGEGGRALATVQPVIKDARDANALEVVGRAQLATGQIDFAIFTLRELVSLRPESADAHQHLATAYEDANIVDRAVLETETALRYAKDSPVLKFQYARLLARAGKLNRANQMLADLRRTHANDVGLIELEGSVALASNRLPEAIAAYTRLFEAQPSSANLLKLARAEVMGGSDQQAYQRIEEWLARTPDDALVRSAFGDSLLNRGEHPRAAEEYAKVLQLAPDNVSVLNNLAWSLTKAGRAADAVPFARRAIGMAPNTPRFFDTLGVALLAADRPQDALAPLRSATELAPNDPSLQFHLAQALARDDKSREARDLLRLILRGRVQWPERGEAEALLQQIGG